MAEFTHVFEGASHACDGTYQRQRRSEYGGHTAADHAPQEKQLPFLAWLSGGIHTLLFNNSTMMRKFLILIVILALLAGAGLATYQFYWKPRVAAEHLAAEKAAAEEAAKAEQAAQQAAEVAALEEFNAAKAMIKKGKLGEAQIALTNYIRNNPEAEVIQEAIDLLGQVNADILFSAAVTPDKKQYTVVSGDTLSGIAQEHGTTAELIMKVNGLDSTMLRVGDLLLVPQAEFELRINHGAQLLDLYKGGVFFKRYRPRAFNLPGGVKIESVLEKVAWKEGERVAFGSPEFLGSTRWIRLQGGYPIYEQAGTGETEHVVPPSQGLELSSDEMRELFAIVNNSTTVIME